MQKIQGNPFFFFFNPEEKQPTRPASRVDFISLLPLETYSNVQALKPSAARLLRAGHHHQAQGGKKQFLVFQSLCKTRATPALGGTAWQQLRGTRGGCQPQPQPRCRQRPRYRALRSGSVGLTGRGPADRRPYGLENTERFRYFAWVPAEPHVTDRGFRAE